MEFPDLGKHCSVSTCQRLDFLPYTCDRCHKVQCDEHRRYDDHKCPVEVDRRVPQCPICGQIIEVLASENVDRKINLHIEAGCPKSEGLKTAKFPCSHARCGAIELQKIVCPFCAQQFCIKHKQPGDHNCVKNPHKAATQNPPATSSQWEVWDKISEGATKLAETLAAHARKLKDSEKTRKVALLKNKSNATGPSSLAPDKRFYLEVVYPLDSKVDPKWFFFDENRKLGVVLDEVASAAKLKNNNNVPNAPKLQLFALKSGTLLPLNKSLKEMKETIASCDPILLEYHEAI